MRSICVCSFACLIWNCPALAQDSSKAPDVKKEVADNKTIRALIAQLADEAFDVREAAQKRLAAVGEPALPQLRAAAKDSKDLEARERVRQLIEAITASFFAEVRRFDRHKNWTTRLVVSPDGRQAIAALRFGALQSWNVEDGTPGVVFEWSAATPSWALALSPEGRQLLVGSEDRVARIFDAKSGKLVKELIGHAGPVHGVAFLEGGKRALTGGMDRSLRVWDVESGREIRAFQNVPDDVQC